MNLNDKITIFIFCCWQSVHEDFTVQIVQKHAIVLMVRRVIHLLENVRVSALDGQDNTVTSVCIYSVVIS